jgi:hypothetical protein
MYRCGNIASNPFSTVTDPGRVEVPVKVPGEFECRRGFSLPLVSSLAMLEERQREADDDNDSDWAADSDESAVVDP